jgi:HD-GYP domain-containing protein (c-di-GMP phosphodiesterase class II)
VAALGVYHVVEDAMRPGDDTWVVLVALAAAGIAEVLVDDLLHVVRARRFYLSTHGRSADLALITSGMLMSVGYDAVAGESLGLWGPLLFSIPLLAAWYSFERLASIRRTYEQTIGALSVVPELAGLVRQGHAARVADLAVRLGRELGLSSTEQEQLRAAALLHHLGHLCLDDPEVRGRPIEPSEVTDKGAEILRQTAYLRPSGDLLASDTASVGGQILRVASAFDELTAGDPAFGEAAIEALYSGPGYVYDPRVLDALERVAGAPAFARL